jgi:hypothetical protein
MTCARDRSTPATIPSSVFGLLPLGGRLIHPAYTNPLKVSGYHVLVDAGHIYIILLLTCCGAYSTT